MTDLRKITEDTDWLIDNWEEYDKIISDITINTNYDEDDVDEIFTESFKKKEKREFIHEFKDVLIKMTCLIKNGELNDLKYHDDMSVFYNLLFVTYEYTMDELLDCGCKTIINKFKKTYIKYRKSVVIPYHCLLICETVRVIKVKTPIADDNICDILSYLNDEKIIKKHTVDTFIYT